MSHVAQVDSGQINVTYNIPRGWSPEQAQPKKPVIIYVYNKRKVYQYKFEYIRVVSIHPRLYYCRLA